MFTRGKGEHPNINIRDKDSIGTTGTGDTDRLMRPGKA